MMSSLLTKDELKNLITHRDDNLISIYMPGRPVGADLHQDTVRLKNLLSDAVKELKSRGVDEEHAESLLKPAKELMEDTEFWQKNFGGIALFIGKDFFRFYGLPLSFDELVVANTRFHVKPLLPVLSGDGRFYILALSKNDVRLLEASKYDVHEIEIKDAPKSMGEAMRYYDFEEHLQQRQRSVGPRGGKDTAFHGHGSGDDREQHDLFEYFRLVDKGLMKILREEHTPLVIAGVDYLHPLYKKASKYNHIVEKGIKGNPDDMPSEELRQKTWDIVEPLFHKEQEHAIEQYNQLAKTEKASNKLESIVPASVDGRVEYLFVSIHDRQWGEFIAKERSITLADDKQSGDEDLLDLAATSTFLNGGKVFAVEREQIPDDNVIASVYRY